MRTQSTAEIKLLPVADDGRPPYWNVTSSFDFDLQCRLCVIIRMSFYIRLRNFLVIGPSDEHRRTSDLMSNFQGGGHRVGNLLPSSGLVTTFVQNGENVFACQISMRYLNRL